MRRIGLVAASLTLLASCGKKEQSAHDAMVLVCEAYTRSGADRKADRSQLATHIVEWVATNVTNAEIKKFIGQVGAGGKIARRDIFAATAKENGLTKCPMAEREHAVELAAASSGVEIVTRADLEITITRDAVWFDDEKVASIENGGIPAAERTAGEFSVTIDKLQQRAMATNAPFAAAVAVDRSTTFRTLYEVLYSATRGAADHIDLTVRASDADAYVPIAVPRKTPPKAPSTALLQAEPVVKMLVAVQKDKVQIMSLSGLEGTLQAPKHVFAPTEVVKIQEALAAIVKARWPGSRPDGDKQIVVMADSTLPVGTVVPVIAAARAGGFPDVALSAGFE